MIFCSSKYHSRKTWIGAIGNGKTGLEEWKKPLLDEVKSVVQAWTRLIFVAATVVIDQKDEKRFFLQASVLYRRRLVHYSKTLLHRFSLGLSILPLSSNSHRFSMPSIKNCNVTSSLHFDFQKILSRDKKFLTIFALIVELLGVFVTFF